MKKKQIAGICGAIVLIAFYFGLKSYTNHVAEQRVNEVIAKAAPMVGIDYGKVTVALLSRNVTISDIVVSSLETPDRLKIDEIILRDFDDESDVPVFFNGSIKGMEVGLDMFGDAAQDIRELGYTQSLLFNTDIDYRYDEKNKDLNIKKIAVSANDVGELSLNLKLGNIDFDPDEMLGLLFTYPQLLIHDAKIDYRDDSLIQRTLQYSARKNGIQVKELKEQLFEMLQAEIDNEKDKFTKNALKAVKKFIEKPEKFSISVSPSKPTPVGRIFSAKDPNDLIEMLDIQIKT